MKKEEITKDTFPKYTPDPLTKDLPDAVKDPANYETIQRQLLDALASKHSHSEVKDWAACVPCQVKVKEHADLMRKLGFQSPAQYKAWQKTQEIIKNKKDIWKKK